MENKSQRDAFWNRIYEIAIDDRDVVAVIADMGAPSLDQFRKNLSSQYFDVGIAEQQAIALAAGLALEGKNAFTYAIAPFMTLRCYEHIRVNLAGMNLPVTMVGVGAGWSYDDSGPTHHAIEDLSIMRILPNLKVYNITDSVMAKAFADRSYSSNHPCYVRLDRENLPDLYEAGYNFSSGMEVLRGGGDLSIIATGNMVYNALETAEILAQKKIAVQVIDNHTFPVVSDRLVELLADTEHVVTLEEHTLPGGLGSAVCEVLADKGHLCKVKRMGLDFRKGYCYKYGGRKNLQALYGLDAGTVAENIVDWLAK